MILASRDGMRGEGVNIVSARGKILREEVRLRGFSVREHYRKLVRYQTEIFGLRRSHRADTQSAEMPPSGGNVNNNAARP